MPTYLHQDTPSAPGAAADGTADGLLVCVRRTPAGVLVVSHRPATGAEPPLRGLLERTTCRVICQVCNDPADPDFDAPVEETAGRLIELVDATGVADRMLVASRDWFAVERARAAGLATAFVSAPGVKVGGGLAYVVSAGHGALIADAGAIGEADPARAREAGVELISWGRTDARVDGIVEDADGGG